MRQLHTDPTRAADVSATLLDAGLSSSKPAGVSMALMGPPPSLTPPTMTLTAKNVWSQYYGQADLFDNVVASTEDDGQTFTGMVISVHSYGQNYWYYDQGLLVADSWLWTSDGSEYHMDFGRVKVATLNGVSTYTFSDMNLDAQGMSALIDSIQFMNWDHMGHEYDPVTGRYAMTTPRSIVLESITDSGATDNTTIINQVATVTQSWYWTEQNPIVVLPDQASAVIPAGTTSAVSFTVNIATGLDLGSAKLYLDVRKPADWTITNLKLNGQEAALTGKVTAGTYTLTFDVTAAASDLREVSTLSIVGTYDGYEYPGVMVNTGSMLAVLVGGPTLQSATIDGDELVLTFDKVLDIEHLPQSSSFKIVVDGTDVAFSGITVDALNKTVTLALAQAVLHGQTVTVSYTDPTTANDIHAIQDQDGHDAASFGARPVTNNTPDAPPPQGLALAAASDSGLVADGITNVTTPTITGVAAAGADIAVYAGTRVVGQTSANEFGQWSVAVDALDEGSHTITATATRNGATSPASQSITVHIDKTAPMGPTVTSAALTNQPTPVISGTAEAGATVVVTVGDAVFRTSSVDGKWSINLATAVPSDGHLALDRNGENLITVKATDVAGNTSLATKHTLVIDTETPDHPVITSAELTRDKAPELSGIAEPGSLVTVTVGGAVYTTVATAGVWRLDLASAVPVAGHLELDVNGSNEVVVTATDAAGNASESASQWLQIDTTPPAKPGFTSGKLTNAELPTITGTADPGVIVTLTVGGATFEVKASLQGTWSVDLAQALPIDGTLALDTNGGNKVDIVAYDKAGNASAGNAQFLVIDTTPPADPVISSSDLTNSPLPIIAGTADNAASVIVVVGGATYGVAAIQGSWQLDLATATPIDGVLALNANGANAIVVTARDAAGNASEAVKQTLTIDTTPPAKPGITSADLVDLALPVISGTAEAGSVLTVNVAGASYVFTATSATWTLDLKTAQPTTGTLTLNANGKNLIDVTASDAAGNQSEAVKQTLVIDTTPPDAPSLSSALAVNTTTPVLSGTAEAGSLVTIWVGDVRYEVLAPQGTWSLDLATATPIEGVLDLTANASHPIDITATDKAGNTSQATTLSLVIDTLDPVAPTIDSAELSSAAAPVLSGTAEVGSLVTVTVAGATYVVKATDGTWAVDLAIATPVDGTLALDVNGSNTVTVTATDKAGNVSKAAEQTLAIDTTDPVAPTLDSAELSNVAAPTLSGTAEVGSTVTVTVAGATYVVKATDGSWTVDLATATPADGTLALNVNGSNAVSVTATDKAGNVSKAAEQSLVIDTTDPVAPTLDSGELSNDALPTLSGTAESGSLITVTVGGATYTLVAKKGAWSLDLATATPDDGTLVLDANGSNTVSITATDKAGNVSEATEHTLVIDTTDPVAPTLDSAELSNVAAPTLSGTAEVGSTVTVTVAGATYVVKATDGTWAVDLATATPIDGTLVLNVNGSNTVSVTATDKAGNVSKAAEQALEIDTTEPVTPGITSSDLGNVAAPALSGTAEVGSTVTLTVAGATYVLKAIDGTWAVDLATATPTSGTLALDVNGSNTVTVTSTDKAGNVSEAAEQTLVIDTTDPVAPTIDSAELSNAAAPTLSGTAEAGSLITVTVGGATYKLFAKNGTWSLDLATATPVEGTLALDVNGSNTVSITATDKAGNVSEATEQTFVIDTTDPVRPTLDSAELSNVAAPTLSGTAEAGSTVTITVAGATYVVKATDGTWAVDLATATSADGTLALNVNGSNAVTVTATDKAGNVSKAAEQSLVIDTTDPIAPSITSSALSSAATPVLSGTAEIGSTITITVAGATYVLKAIDGTWAVDLATATPTSGTLALDVNGSNPITVTATDKAGNVSLAAEQTLEIDTTDPVAPTLDSAELSNVAAPTLSGTAELGSTVTVTIAGATYVVQATDGTWTVDLAMATPADGTLALNVNGSNAVTVTATDKAGNVSKAAEQILVIDTTDPVAPTLDSAELSNVAAPTLSGTAEVGSTVTVTIAGATYVVQATDGSWTVDLATATPADGTLALNVNGSNAVTVTATDKAGNVSKAAEQSLVIDTTDPVAPTLDSGELSNDALPTLSGTAESGSLITVTVGGATYTLVAKKGAWSLDLATATPVEGTLVLDANGSNTITVTATDKAGNVSKATEHTLVIDTTDPSTPTITSAALTNAEAPLLTGTADVGTTVTVWIAGASYSFVATEPTWSLDLASAVPSTGTLALNVNGVNPVTVVSTDAAGNAVASEQQSLVIDTTAPAAPEALSLPTGITNKPTVSVPADALEAGATWQYSIDGGKHWIDDEGSNFTLTDGTYASGQVQVRQLDAAGNPGDAVHTQGALVIDTAPPEAPTLTSTTLTNVGKPSLKGTAEPGSTVTVEVAGATYVLVAADGAWQLNLAQAAPVAGKLDLNTNGTNPVTVTATDAAGNLSPAATQWLVIDTAAPAAPNLSIAAGATQWMVTLGGLESGGQWEYRLADGPWVQGTGTGFTLPLQDLAAGALQVRQTDAAGNQGETRANPIAIARPDTDADGDGLPDHIENGVPGMIGGTQGDGNGDGIADIEQSDVTSLIWATSPDGQARYVTLANHAGLVQQGVKTSALEAGNLPGKLALPLGMLEFTVRDVAVGGTVDFSIYLDADVPVNGYWKQIDGQWVNLATAVTQEGGKIRIDFSIEDGGVFDADGERNGVIVDPGAPGWFDGNPFDTDGDQVPDRLELDLGLTVGQKDNDVFERDDLFVMQLYRDALGRETEASGLTYWQTQLEAGTLDRAALVQRVVDSAEARPVVELTQLSLSLLGNAPDASELAAWRAALADGDSVLTLANAIVAEVAGIAGDDQFIDLLYQQLLERDADADGRAYWLNEIQAGDSRAEIALQFVASAEFAQAWDAETSVTLWYAALLGREVDIHGMAYWSEMLDLGASASDVIVAIIGTDEYHDRFLPADLG